MMTAIGDGPSIPAGNPPSTGSSSASPAPIVFPTANTQAAASIKNRVRKFAPPPLSHSELEKLFDSFESGNTAQAEELLKGHSIPSLHYRNFKDLRDLASFACRCVKAYPLMQLLADNLEQHSSFDGFKIDLLNYVVSDNNLLAVEAVLKNGNYTVPTSVVDIAMEKQLLSVGKLLRPDFIEQASLFLSKKEPAELEQLLVLGFLNSSAKDSLDLIAQLKKIVNTPVLDKVEQFIHNEGSIIARFPETWKQELMISSYNSDPFSIEKSTYYNMQMNFAKKRYANYTNILNKTDLDFPALYRMQMQPRVSENKDSYLKLRHSPTIDIEPQTTPIVFRYQAFASLAHSTFNTEDPHLIKSKSQLKLTKELQRPPLKGTEETDAYTLTITLRSGKQIPLTTVHILQKKPSLAVWEHTSAQYLPDLEKEQQLLFEETKQPLPFPELKRKIAYFYYLGIQAMYSYRGNSQSMLELHKLLYARHNIPVPPPNQQFVLPDCVALCLPFETFFTQYYDKLWEWPIAPQ